MFARHPIYWTGLCALVLVACDDPAGPVALIEVTPNRAALRVADSLQLQARLLDAAGDEVSGAVTWSSDDTAVVRVTEDGLAIGVGDGAAIVRATLGNRAGASAVSVTGGAIGAPGDSVVPSIPELTLIAAETTQLTAVLVTAAGDTVTDTEVAWSSSDDRVAVVTAAGLVTAVDVGTATVSASIGLAEAGMVTVAVAPTFASISAGADHACGVSVDGEAFCWGAGASGRLGNGLVTDQARPVSVLTTGGATWEVVHAGQTHTCGLATGGRAFCWGANDRGQLGSGTTGGSESTRKAVVGGLQFDTIVVGGSHSCGIVGGTVHCWGSGTFGQTVDLTYAELAVPTPVGPPFTSLGVGINHTCALDAAGAASCWGDNLNRQLGNTRLARLTTVRTLMGSGLRDVGGTSSSSVVVVGQQSVPFCIESGVTPGSPARLIVNEAEPNNSIAQANSVSGGDTVLGRIDPSSDLDHFGFQANVGDTIVLAVDALAVGSTLDADLALFDSVGSLLINSTQPEPRVSFPVTVSGRYFAQVSEGASGQQLIGDYRLGVGTARLETCGATFEAFRGGGWQQLARVEGLLIGVWQVSPSSAFVVGSLGEFLEYDGAAVTRRTSVPATTWDVWAIGPNDVFAATDAGVFHYDGAGWVAQDLTPSVRAIWGATPNDIWAGTATGTIMHYNGLGWSITASGFLPIGVLWGSASDDVYAGAGGAVLHYDGSAWTTQQQLPGLVSVTGIWGTSTGRVYAVGLNAVGESRLFATDGSGWRDVATNAQVRFESVFAPSTDTAYVVARDAGFIFTGFRPRGHVLVYDAGGPTAVDGMNVFASLEGGAAHTCGVTPAGAALCWGSNVVGQLGVAPDTATRPNPTLVQGGHVFAAISAAGSHTCGVTTAGDVYCWGRNAKGEVGDGTTTKRTAPVLIDLGEPAALVTTGAEFTCAVTVRGVGFCWGDNGFGQLGDGTTANRATPARVIGSR